jgi:anti-sigma B factor antagonist
MLTEPTSTETVLALVGEFDIAQRDVLKDALSALGSQPTVVLDLSQTTYFDSSVLSLLVTLRAERDMRGAALIIVGASRMVKRIFDLTSLSKVFDMRPSLEM